MRSLRELQRGFAEAILDPGASAAAPLIFARGLSPARRLDIYRVSIFENYRKALAAMFPVSEQLVGKGYFSLLTEEFVRAVPSDSGDVGDYGERFPEFLDSHYSRKQLPYLADVARLEWAAETVFHAADTQPLKLESLAALAPEAMGSVSLRLAPHCRLLHSEFPVHRIWQINQPGADVDTGVDLSEGAVDLLIARHSGPYRIEIRPVGADHFHMFTRLADGAALADALVSTLSAHPRFDLGLFLQTYVPPGLLHRLTIGANSSDSDIEFRRSSSSSAQRPSETNLNAAHAWGA